MSDIDIPLVIRKSDDDWYVIERRNHEGRVWLEEIGPRAMAIRDSARLGDADIEGTWGEMVAIAQAIKSGGGTRFRRCAVSTEQHSGGGVLLWSPRNSTDPSQGRVSHANAQALADEILAGAATRKG